MICVDLDYRDFLAKKIQKNVANLNFSAHLNNADPYANPIQAALFFKKFWSDKYELFKN